MSDSIFMQSSASLRPGQVGSQFIDSPHPHVSLGIEQHFHNSFCVKLPTLTVANLLLAHPNN